MEIFIITIVRESENKEFRFGARETAVATYGAIVAKAITSDDKIESVTIHKEGSFSCIDEIYF